MNIFSLKINKKLDLAHDKSKFAKNLKKGEDIYIKHYLDLKKVDGNMEIYFKDEFLGTMPIYTNKKLNEIFARRNSFKGLITLYQETEEKDEAYIEFQIVRFCDLHRHSAYSLLDGAIPLKTLVKRTEYGGALTDHGNMFATLSYYKLMKAMNKKPIVGFEAYCETINGKKESNHLILLAKNEVGFKNLVKLTSDSYNNVYKKPHVSYAELEKHKEGVICTSACLGGEIPQLLKHQDYEGAKKVAQKFKDMFGEDFYIEIQRHNFEEEKMVEQPLIDLAKELGIKLITTTDSHYVDKEDAYAHEIVLCLQTQKTIDEPHMKFSGEGYYLHDSDEMFERFKGLEEAVENTLEIEDKCNLEITLDKLYMPKFAIPAPFKSDEAYFEYLCRQGYEERFKGTPQYDDPVYRERFEYELAMIKDMKFPGYFLIVWDYINFARTNGIAVGPGRGSCVGSLVSYCLKISDLDPIPYGLLFQRFLNPERVSMPDIDTDFDDERRPEVIEYAKQKYGADCVSRIITFGSMASRMVVRDVSRVLGVSVDKADKLAKAIPEKATLKEALETSVDFKNQYESDDKIKKVVDISMKLEGLPRHCSIHACFDKNTLVTTSNGLKKIIDVEVGDYVLTHNNQFKPVEKTMETMTDKVYKIKAQASSMIEVTENHPMYVREMNKKRLRKYKDGKESSIKEFSQPIWKKVSDLKVGQDYLGIAINQNSIIPAYNEYNLSFDNYDFWWLIGRYMGDGWTEMYTRKTGIEKRVIICCSKDKERKEIESYLQSLNYRYRVEEVNTTYKIHIHVKGLYEYLQQFGKYAGGKKLTKDIFNLPINLLEGFLKGYISADGYYRKKEDRYVIKTISKELAIGTMQIINKVYHRPACIQTLKTKQEIIEGRTVNSKEKYEISFTVDKRAKERSFYENGYIWSRLSSIEIIEDTRKMYNLTVLDDSSYVVNGVIAHNCGVVIAPSSVSDYLPTILLEDKKSKIKGKKELTSQFIMSEVEEMGILKMDFLGLRTMGVISNSIELINRRLRREGKPEMQLEDIFKINLCDRDVYKNIIAKGNTFGVFQLESPGMIEFMKDLFADVSSMKEEDLSQLFERLIAGISLYRPGPMDSIPQYLENMRDAKNIKYDTPELEPILKDSYGVIVYQETVMQIVRDLAGYSLGRSDIVRKAMGKKKLDVMEKEKEIFLHGLVDDRTNEVIVPGCERNGIDLKIAEKIWDTMAEFAKYAFNKSHASAYALVGYITAWLSYYYPIEFMTSILNSYILNSDRLKMYLASLRKKGITILPPDINKSEVKFVVESDTEIRFGLMGLRNMGASSKQVIAERNERGLFKDYQDFAERMAKYQKVDKKILESLIYSGAVDCFEGTRIAKLTILDKILNGAKAEKIVFESGQLDMFSMTEEMAEIKKIHTPIMKELDKKIKLSKEKEYAGLYISEHPLDDYDSILKDEEIIEISNILPAEDEDMENTLEAVSGDNYTIVKKSSFYENKNVTIAGVVKDIKTFFTKKDNKKMFVFKIEDRGAEISCVLFNQRVEANEDKLVEDKVVVLQGKVKDDDRGIQIIADNLSDIEFIKNAETPKSIWFKVYSEKQKAQLISFVKENQGNVPVFIRYRDTRNFKCNYNLKFSVSICDRLKNMFGENMKIVYMNNK